MIPQEIREGILPYITPQVKTFPPEVLPQLESALKQELVAMNERIARLEHALNQIRGAISNNEPAGIDLFHQHD